MTSNQQQFFLSQLTEKRRALFDLVLPQRTNHITVVLEDFYQPHNFSAVLRSCDCFGVHQVNIIENNNKYQRNPKINMGSDKWLDIVKHNKSNNNTPSCLSELKSKGYRIVAAHPHGESTDIEALDLTQKTAFVFGTEQAGISKDVMELADAFMHIPMYGFTESFNVSVAAALTLSSIKRRLLRSDIPWQLNEEDKHEVLEMWLSRSVADYKKLKLEWAKRNPLS